MAAEDILVEIPNEDLPKLAKLYAENVPFAAHMVGFINTMIKWKQSIYSSCVKIFSPNSSWQKDGTIVAFVTCHSVDVHLFTLDPHYKNLRRALLETNRFDFSKDILFFCVDERFRPILTDLIQSENLKIVHDIPCFLYAISPNQASSFTIEYPSDVTIKKLEPSAAQHINDLWPHKSTNSDKQISAVIEINGGYGVFLESSNEMASWVLRYFYDHPGMLHTEEAHQRKGYAALLIKYVSKEIAKNGHWTISTIVINNVGSIKMFEKLGFKQYSRVTFLKTFAKEN